MKYSAKKKPVKALKMFAAPSSVITDHVISGKESDTHFVPVAVLDISDPKALVEQAAESILVAKGVLGWAEVGPIVQFFCRREARAVLQSLGILPAKKGRK